MPDILDFMPESMRERYTPAAEQPAQRSTIFDFMPAETRSHYTPDQIEAARQAAPGDHYQEDSEQYLARRSVPFYSSIRNFMESREYTGALGRIRDGHATQSDRDIVAGYENRQRHEQNQSTLESVGGALAHVPALVGEAMAGGAVAGRIAGGVPGVAGWAARTGLTTAAMPSMWMDQWTQS